MWGRLFASLAWAVMFTIYYTYVVLVWGPRAEEDEWVFGMLIIFNVNFVMLLWSFCQAMRTDAGEVPAFWGFSAGDQATDVKRRYCLMCNVFKPERCHHCSACNRCVLNMDHHCLWINNCVGFWNRKPFLLLLMYAQTITLLVEFTLSYDFYLALEWGFTQQFLDHGDDQLLRNLLVLVSFMLNSIICFLITAFFKFHWALATQNKTTIENLEHDGVDYVSKYDIGKRENLAQIFGSSPWLFFLPIHSGSGLPHGDGVNFRRNVQLAENGRTAVKQELRQPPSQVIKASSPPNSSSPT